MPVSQKQKVSFSPRQIADTRHPQTLIHFVYLNAVVTCEIKLFQNYFSLRRHPSEIIFFQRVETRLKLFHRLIAAHEYFPTCSLSLK